MNNQPSVFNGQRFTDRDLIEAVVSQFYILDYGFVDKVNDDDTVNVTHATKPLTLTGESLDGITTENVEVLTFATAELAIDYKIKKGDKVLLLGLKNPIASVGDVSQAEDSTSRLHYSRETLKAFPLCVFNSDAKVTLKTDNGKLSIKTEDATEIDAKEVSIKGQTSVKVNGTSTVELNGNTKQFVTWTELNTALTAFVTQLNAALMGANVNVMGVPVLLTWQAGNPPTAIDISAAKTTTVVTGG